MGSSIAIDISATSNVQPIADTRNAIALTTAETKEFGRILAENNNNLDLATQKFLALKNAATGAAPAAAGAAGAGGGAGGGGAPNSLAAVPDIIDRTNRQVDAMNPRLRTAAAALSRLSFEATNMGGSVQGAVRSAGMLSYSLAGLSDNAKIAGSAAGIGAIAIVIAAGIGLWEEWHQKMEDARRTLDAINAASVGYAAQLKGNQLGAREEQMATAFEKQVAEIEKKYKPGWLLRLLGGLQEATMSGRALGEDVSKGLVEALGQSVYGATGEHALAVREDVMRKALANAGGFAAGAGDPVTRYKAQLRVIELERDAAVQRGEMSAEAADARAEGQRRALRKQGEDLNERLGAEIAARLSALTDNVFTQRQKAEDVRFHDEMSHLDDLKLSEEARVAIVDQIRLKHNAITLEIEKQRKETEAQGRIQAGEGDINPITRARAEIAAIEERRKKNVEAGMKEVDAAKIAENEKRNLYTQTLDAAVRSSDSLGKVLKRAALEPVVSFLEGLAIQEGIKAIAHFADFDLVGGALHTAAAAAAAGGAREVAQLGGLTSGGSSGRGGGGGGAGQFVPNAQQQGGNQTVLIQIGDVSNQALVNTLRYEIDRSGMLGKPVVAPMGRPS